MDPADPNYTYVPPFSYRAPHAPRWQCDLDHTIFCEQVLFNIYDYHALRDMQLMIEPALPLNTVYHLEDTYQFKCEHPWGCTNHTWWCVHFLFFVEWIDDGYRICWGYTDAYVVPHPLGLDDLESQ